MLSVLYPLLIVVGLTIVGVMLILWRQARIAAQLNLALIELNEALHFDAPALLQQAWSLLERGGVVGMRWQLNWFGVLLEDSAGVHTGVNLQRKIVIGEMNLSINVWLRQAGERRYFSRSLVESFFLLLRTDMWIKSGTIDATLAQMAKLNLFLQHDMKNIAQFIQLMADQLQDASSENDARLLLYLRKASPMVRQRADHIVQSLTLGRTQKGASQQVDLGVLFQSLCDLYQVRLNLIGHISIEAPAAILERAFDNIFKNYHDLYRRESIENALVSVTLERHEDGISVVISDHRVQPKRQLERLFEPFWSCDPAGLGIGLYQAKSLLQECRGELSAKQNEIGELSFHIFLSQIRDISICK